MIQRENLISRIKSACLKVTNLNGKVVYFKAFNTISKIVDLNLNSLSAGVYILSISQGKHCDYRNLVITR